MKKAYALNFPRVKRKLLTNFFPEYLIQFVNTASLLPEDSIVFLWGMTLSNLPNKATCVRIEDGFLRSNGLGAYLAQPLSWVVDERGLYLNPKTTSKLEQLLQTTDFNDELLNRAKHLRQIIISKGLTKYNLSERSWLRPKTTKKVILVPGQVENDASVRFGSPVHKTNHELLRAVRKQNPNAYIVYKPHPDVQCGLRFGQLAKGDKVLFDELITDICPTSLLNGCVDEVHTLTSLLGFEALLRNVPVYCYGQPFYAGWGLTHDCAPISRRTRMLSLDELVAASLILYPRYISPLSQKRIEVEQAIKELIALRDKKKSLLAKGRSLLIQKFIDLYTHVYRRRKDPNF